MAPNYLNEPKENWLLGPPEDVTFLKDMLSDCAYIDIKTLCGPEATGDDILWETGRILHWSRRGDLIIIYLSGHGATNDRGPTGYEFFAQSTRDPVGSRHNTLTYQVLLRHIINHQTRGSYVLVIRDTCEAGPTEGEILAMLGYPADISIIVLAACDSGEKTWECGNKPPRSVFLQNIISAVGRLWQDKVHALSDLVVRMIDQVLRPIVVGGVRQTPRLEPDANRSKVLVPLSIGGSALI